MRGLEEILEQIRADAVVEAPIVICIIISWIIVLATCITYLWEHWL